MFRKNVACRKIKKLSSWRKISLATWKTSYDPSIYGNLEVNATEAIDLIREIRETTGVKVTLTHLVIKAIARALASYPELNALIRHNYLYQRDSVDIFVQVFHYEEGKKQGKPDLSGVKISQADQKSLIEIARELQSQAGRVKSGEASEIKQTKSIFKILPTRLLAWMLRIVGYLNYDMNWDLSRFGIQKDPFGAAMVTNVGVFGLSLTYAPLVPFSRAPIIFAVGEVEEKAVVKNGEVTVLPMLHLGGTVDHRIIDGYMAGLAAKIMKESLEHPRKFFSVA